MTRADDLRDELRSLDCVTNTYCVHQYVDSYGDKVWMLHVLWSDGSTWTHYDRDYTDGLDNLYRRALIDARSHAEVSS